MDQESGVRAPRLDFVENLVERHFAETEVAEVEPQDEKCGGHPAGHGDLERLQLLPRELVTSDHDGAVARTHARPVRQHRVSVLDIRVRVQRDRGRLEPAVDRPFVQRLDVAQDMLELEPACVDLIRGERPEHERVVGIGTVSEPDQHVREVTASTHPKS